MEHEPATSKWNSIPDLNMQRFLAWYQVLIAVVLVIMAIFPFFHAILRIDCDGTTYAFTFMAWIFGMVSITGTSPPYSCAPSYLWNVGVLVLTWFFSGILFIGFISSIYVLHKKPGPTFEKIRDEVTGNAVGLLLVSAITNGLDLLASGYSPAGLTILIPALLMYLLSRRLYISKEQLAERGQRIAEIQQNVAKEIIAGHQDALLNEIQEIMAGVTVPWVRSHDDRSYDFIPKVKELEQRIRFMAGILQSLRENESMNIDSLKVAFATSDFPAAILELCKQFNLTIQGSTIQIASSVDPNDFLTEIDRIFTTWNRNEAAKLAKI